MSPSNYITYEERVAGCKWRSSERMVGQQEVIQMGIERFKDEPSGNQG